jgi:hypothetical protein
MLALNREIRPIYASLDNTLFKEVSTMRFMIIAMATRDSEAGLPPSQQLIAEKAKYYNSYGHRLSHTIAPIPVP